MDGKQVSGFVRISYRILGFCLNSSVTRKKVFLHNPIWDSARFWPYKDQIMLPNGRQNQGLPEMMLLNDESDNYLIKMMEIITNVKITLNISANIPSIMKRNSAFSCLQRGHCYTARLPNVLLTTIERRSIEASIFMTIEISIFLTIDFLKK